MEWDAYKKNFGGIMQSAKSATEAYEYGTRLFDQLKEVLLIQHGLVYTSEFFHNIAHWFPTQFDLIGDILHQRHLLQLYGATPSVNDMPENVDECFKFGVDAILNIDNRLEELSRECTQSGAGALSYQVDDLRVALSAKLANVLAAWKMLDESTSSTSFDGWMEDFSD